MWIPVRYIFISKKRLTKEWQEATVVAGWNSHTQTNASNTHIWPSRKGLYGAWGCLPWTLAGTNIGGEKSIRGKGVVVGVQWLLQQHRRRGKAFSSLVVFLKRVVGIAESMYVKMQGRKHMVEEYEWGRRPSHWAAEG